MFTVKVNGTVLFHDVSFTLAINAAMANVHDGMVTVWHLGECLAAVDATLVRKHG